jgi:hypothetical protein
MGQLGQMKMSVHTAYHHATLTAAIRGRTKSLIMDRTREIQGEIDVGSGSLGHSGTVKFESLVVWAGRSGKFQEDRSSRPFSRNLAGLQWR